MSFKVEQMEEKNMVKLVIETTAEEFEKGLNEAYNKNKGKITLPALEKVRLHVRWLKSFMEQKFSMKMLLMQSFQKHMQKLLKKAN